MSKTSQPNGLYFVSKVFSEFSHQQYKCIRALIGLSNSRFFSEISLDNDNVPVWKPRRRDQSRQSRRNDIKTRARRFENRISVRRYVAPCRDDFIVDG